MVVVIGLTVALGFSSSTGRAQTALAVFDTLNVRHDLSKPAITRFQAARYHVTACMYAGQVEEQRRTALLMLDLANELKQDTILAHANVVVGYTFRQGNDQGQSLEYDYKGLAYAQRGGVPDQIGWAEKEIGILFKQLGQFREAITWLKRGEAKITRIARGEPHGLPPERNIQRLGHASIPHCSMRNAPT